MGGADVKGLVQREEKLYVRKVYKNSAGKRKYIWRKVESRTDAKTVLREIENELARGTESFENRDTLDSYLDESWTIASLVNSKCMSAAVVSTRSRRDLPSRSVLVRPHSLLMTMVASGIMV
jgi:hypothetical protein